MAEGRKGHIDCEIITIAKPPLYLGSNYSSTERKNLLLSPVPDSTNRQRKTLST